MNGLTLDEILRALPLVLDDETWYWFRREQANWRVYTDFEAAFRLQFKIDRDLALRNRPPHARAAERYFDVPVEIQEFVRASTAADAPY